MDGSGLIDDIYVSSLLMYFSSGQFTDNDETEVIENSTGPDFLLNG